MSRKPELKIAESDVVALWQKQISQRRDIADAEGKSVEIIYPGRPNDSRGADFRDAVVDSYQGRRQGCIEIHTLASSWQAHGHHKDPVYNQVVLHVALKQGKAGQTVLQNGQQVPTVILEPRPGQRLPPAAIPGLPCAAASERTSTEDLVDCLERAGDRRFAARAAKYQSSGSPAEAGEELYQGLLESLGYAQNKLPFRELARRTPLQLLATMIPDEAGKEEGLDRLQSLLLGMAGFLPSQRPGLSLLENEYITNIEEHWSSRMPVHSLNFRHWELFKVRPGNHPIRRLIALSQLLYRFRKPGLVPALLDLVRQSPVDGSPADLEMALAVRAQGYWANRYDFGASDPAISPVLLGRERAAEILVNVVFPFAFSRGQMVTESELSLKAKDLYQRYPRLETNSIERHMQQQLALNRRLLNSARRQQGLLQIYKTLCIEGKCRECELSR